MINIKVMDQQRILFIVNPISGSKPGKFKQQLIERYLNLSRFYYQIYETKSEGDGYHHVRKSLNDYDGFIAVGGDGTINEVFKAVLGTNKWFSIIPNGSGNGLARTLKIPLDPGQALQNLNKAKLQKIDYALINSEPFINVAGIGFDAKIASKFKTSTRRGFRSYAEITLNEFRKMKSRRVKITFEGQSIKTRILMASFANSSQFGNNAHIAPKAKLNDGKLRIITFKKFHWLSAPYLAWLLFNRSIDQSKFYREFIVQKATIKSKKKLHLHIDGEARGKVKNIELEIVPGGVIVMA